MNKKIIIRKLRYVKRKTIALWWFLTHENFFLFVFKNKKGKQYSCLCHNVNILSFIDQVQRWNNMLTAHDILVALDKINKLAYGDILVRNEVKELMEKIKKQDSAFLGPETKSR